MTNNIINFKDEKNRGIGSINIKTKGTSNYIEIEVYNRRLYYELTPRDVSTLKRSVKGLHDYLG